MAVLAKEIVASQRARSIAWLAREIGISRSGLSRRLDGKIRWRPGEAETVARLLGVPMHVVVSPFPGSDGSSNAEVEAVA